MGNATAKDIAKKLGLSPATVSVALNGKPGVSQATRERVLAAAAELGYAMTKGILPEHNLLCFLIYTDPAVGVARETTFYTFVLQGVETAAKALGYRILIRHYDADCGFEEQVCDILGDISGMIVLGTDMTLSRRAALGPFLGETELPFPIVIIDNFTFSAYLDCVGNDNLYGAKSAISHLIDLGHRRIGYLRAQQRITNFDDREHGIKMALLEHTGPDAPPLEIIPVDIAADKAFADVSAWLRGCTSLPDALFAENDVVAAAAIRALKANRVRVPDDVSIMGFDNVPICEMVDPTISTVHSFKEKLGSTAVSLLHRRILNRDTVRTAQASGVVKIAMSTRIIDRSSVVRRTDRD
ncbi:MAG: LacI family transcriptional regulator [Oscillospiraceae bacterium]|nr:LacI family transcriptional regulator [Oscillospiraceae bacterium]